MQRLTKATMYRPFVDPARRAVRRWIFGDVVRFDPGPPYIIAEAPTYAPARVVVYSEDDPPIRVGRYSSIHETVTFMPGGDHRTDVATTWYFYYQQGIGDTPEVNQSRGPIVVGSDVWIGREATIVSGVTIGHGAIVGMNALVTKNVAPYEIVGGVPAKHLRWRFSEEIRAGLLATGWWDWPVDTVTAHRHQLKNPDVARFIALHTGVPSQPCEACDLDKFMPLPRYPAESQPARTQPDQPQPQPGRLPQQGRPPQPGRPQTQWAQPHARPQPAQAQSQWAQAQQAQPRAQQAQPQAQQPRSQWAQPQPERPQPQPQPQPEPQAQSVPSQVGERRAALPRRQPTHAGSHRRTNS